MILDVDARTCLLRAGAHTLSCAIGRTGAVDAAAKREGDGATPIGAWPVRCALLRPDADIRPPARLPWRWLRRHDGWCDEASDPAYNRPVRLPYAGSAETLWRDDRAYDVVVVLGQNDSPPIAGSGSAIFFHLSTGRSTEGCVAIARADMAAILAMLAPGDVLRVTAAAEARQGPADWSDR